ncbi:alpha/beta fold hydrolase [Prauserella cavernicola]|uniref:Alpha/beta hydrolase n=1 Tax=Prauserella cavernicola TaxID=2800127 RepID=A0A934V481_9PSEU|nr:alpha/beta hydrolase [Prauserella cavernicola]MBK1788096.1 alpha/beta hydrolase [Prauserella cavernicola]
MSPPGGWWLRRSWHGRFGTVRWDSFGEPDAEPVVLLHGTPFSSFVWRGLARALARRRRVYVWDLPGYGASEKFAGQDLSFAGLTEAFTGLLEHWELTEPDVVAHDSGGAVALGAHLLRGVSYRSLTLVDAVALGPWGSPFSSLAGEHAEVFARLPSALHTALLREYVSSAAARSLSPDVLAALTQPWLGEAGQEAFYRQLAQRTTDAGYVGSLGEHYPGITLPVLVCWGSEDAWVPADRGRELAALIPSARLEILAGAGHLVPEDSPAELTAAVAGFLG